MHGTTKSGFLRALVVEPRLADSLFVISALTSAGYRVTVADFQQAKALVAASPPDLLVVDICQREFNGLHLAIRAKSMRPALAAVVTCKYEDVVLQRETDALGAAFVVTPTTREELLAAAARTLWRDHGAVEPIRPPFERRVAQRRQGYAAAPGPDRRLMDRRRASSVAV